MTDDWSTGEIVRAIKGLQGTVDRMDSKLDGLSIGFLPRSEWSLWAESRDREIRDLKAARAPWWTWAAVLIAAASLLLNLIPRLTS